MDRENRIIMFGTVSYSKWYASVQIAGSFFDSLNPVPGSCNPFAPAHGTPAGSCQLCPIPKHEPAVGTGSRFQCESLCAVPRERLDHMRKMFFNQPFRNACHLCQLIRRQPRADQQLDNTLADSTFGRRHETWYAQRGRKTSARKLRVSGFMCRVVRKDASETRNQELETQNIPAYSMERAVATTHHE